MGLLDVWLFLNLVQRFLFLPYSLLSMASFETVDLQKKTAYSSLREGILVLIDPSRICNQVMSLGMQVNHDYANKSLVLVPVMLGGMVFCADLSRRLSIDAVIDPISINSYEGTQSTGQFRLLLDAQTDLKGKDVLVIEDIVDSGRSLGYLKDHLEKKGPRSLRVAALLSKPSKRIVPIEADYTCFTVPDLFVVGYGLDYEGKYRNLPFVGVLEKYSI